MLEIRKLDFGYTDRFIFKNVNFCIGDGQLLHLKGDNGVGKTTLLKVILGIFFPKNGSILYNGMNILDNLFLYQKNICFVGHKLGFSPFLTVKENIFFDINFFNLEVDYRKILRKFNLQDFYDDLCYYLSTGQKRLVSLLRILITNAKFWLLDEPFVSLDKRMIVFIEKIMFNHLSCGGMILLISHQDIVLKKINYLEYFLYKRYDKCKDLIFKTNKS
ncbi:heme ABC exporter ATP-binding protein CcmA [Candidatus Legionella polyplacis]|uniref:Heme ABC exporter ATP-binding protein CcmA n=1 Tax=Candidatus Legionella polyplacis TaxID=2005262 RepID=A0ABZ2GW12_9GAMM|nr:heme ABC exporter ATP-binding protein CcmA [Candidatus Legionella polyplacis]ATW01718.1 heme ABC exporter ATP-binding protein CcmA [Candidatus Legionella polyplacis]